MPKSLRTSLYLLLGCLIGGGILTSACAASHKQSLHSSTTLEDKLKRLSAKYGILIEGLEKTGHSPARPTQGPLQQQLKKLLADFNYVLIQSPDKGVEQIIILNPKDTSPPLPERIVLTTERIGNHHVIRATIVGPKPASIEVPLLVDTGASLVVLPASMLSELGFSPGDFEERKIQTANGLIEARVGQLPAIKVGTEVIRNVEAAFIEDSRLGGNGLLGMNVLGRYRMIIDDERNLISLIRQP